VVRTIYHRERHEFVPCGQQPHREGGRRVGFMRGEFAEHSVAGGQYEYGGNDPVLGPRGAMGHGIPFVVHVVLQGEVWVFHLGERKDFSNPTFEEMARHWFDLFCTNPIAESFAHSRSRFLFCRWEAWRAFG
jgi:hypothetical protein